LVRVNPPVRVLHLSLGESALRLKLATDLLIRPRLFLCALLLRFQRSVRILRVLVLEMLLLVAKPRDCLSHDFQRGAGSGSCRDRGWRRLRVSRGRSWRRGRIVLLRDGGCQNETRWWLRIFAVGVQQPGLEGDDILAKRIVLALQRVIRLLHLSQVLDFLLQLLYIQFLPLTEGSLCNTNALVT
jgi:hypothetical protein